MSNATEVIEVNVNLNAGAGPLHGSLRLGCDEPRNFRGWPELADLIAAASEAERAALAAGHAHNVTPLELALSPGSASTVTIRCYVADPDVG